jgi:alanine-glyoxylate transaminase/(R)-3-amino-2-methylpropionate-pyruvate transaminase
VSAGHCHPKVVDAIVKQLQRVQHTTTIYLNEQIALFGKELAETLPGDLKVRTYHYPGRLTTRLPLCAHC